MPPSGSAYHLQLASRYFFNLAGSAANRVDTDAHGLGGFGAGVASVEHEGSGVELPIADTYEANKDLVDGAYVDNKDLVDDFFATYLAN